MRKHIFILCLFCLLHVHIKCKINPVLLISFDGLQSGKFNEFIKQYPNSNFSKFINEGIHAQYLIPSFPTVTFSNHITLITGLYPESHGIIANSFYDPRYNKKFVNSNLNDLIWWNETETIWLMAKRQNRKTGAIFWLSSSVESRTPDLLLPFNPSYSPSRKIDEAVKYISKENVDLTVIYFDEPDYTGHEYGESSKEYKNKIKDVDDIFGELIYKMNKEGVYDNTNIIVVSDHGMTDQKNIIVISDHMNIAAIDMNKTTFGVISHIYPIPGQEENVYRNLKVIPNLNVYYKNETPEDYHYVNNRRIGPIIALASEGYMLETSVLYESGGLHGYSNTYESMRAIFLARGPSFKMNQMMCPFQNVNICPLVCELLHIKCNPNNGTVEIFKKYLKSSSPKLCLSLFQFFIYLVLPYKLVSYQIFY